MFMFIFALLGSFLMNPENMTNSDLLTCWLSGAGENEIYSSAVGSDDEQKKGSESIVKEYLSCLCTMNSIREFTQLGSLAAWSKVILCSHTTVTYACYNPPPSSAAVHPLHRMKIAMYLVSFLAPLQPR